MTRPHPELVAMAWCMAGIVLLLLVQIFRKGGGR
jgi:hypothetical protein